MARTRSDLSAASGQGFTAPVSMGGTTVPGFVPEGSRAGAKAPLQPGAASRAGPTAANWRAGGWKTKMLAVIAPVSSAKVRNANLTADGVISKQALFSWWPGEYR